MALIAFLTKLANVLFGPHYRPERHYMRGPGPACRRAPTTTTPIRQG